MSNTSLPKKTRAKNLPENRVGMQRHDIYKQAYNHINRAMNEGFYLESITLIESMISDRLESRLSQILETDFSFKTLGDLIDQSKRSETDVILRDLVINDLNEWRRKRNNSIHEMVKVETGDISSWENRIQGLTSIATKGLFLLKKIAKRVESLRKNQTQETKLTLNKP
jgi:hypothetical protein